MKHEERRLHIGLVDWLRLALPPDCVVIHPANGEKRAPKTAALLKRLGVVPGVPDLLVFWKGKAYAIEVKSAKGRLSPAQEDMIARLLAAGVQTMVVRGFEGAESFLRNIGIPLKATVTARAA